MKTEGLKVLTLVTPDTTQINIDRIPKCNMLNLIKSRKTGEFADKALHLNSIFGWVLGYDSYGSIILVPVSPQEDENP